MASRRSSGGNESNNTGLVVALVFFVLASIGLGVGTYMGYSAKTEALGQAKKANDEKTAADKQRRQEQALRLGLLTAIGADKDTDRTNFSGLKGEFTADIQAQIDPLGRQPKWWDVSTTDKPAKTLNAHIADLQAAVQTANAQAKAKENELAESQRKDADQIQQLQAQVKTGTDNLKKANDALVQAQSKTSAGADDLSARIKQLSEQLQQLTLDKQNQEVDLNRKVKELEAKIATYAQGREQFRGKVGPLLEKLEQVRASRPDQRDVAELYELLSGQFEPIKGVVNDTAKGSIVRVDRSNGTVYISLGSADYVRPGLTFSVLPAGSTGKAAASRERKGAIEVVSVLEAHLSSAKVVDAANPLRDPLLPGDLLFNPSWNPNQREHVAIAGIIDLNGDGLDDTPDLIRNLERQGVVVDAYLDLRDRTVKGEMTVKTTYLILGEKPTLPANVLPDANPLAAAATDVLGKIEEMKTKARDLGAEPVAYRRFLSLIGYKLPRQLQPEDYGQSSYLRNAAGSLKKPDEGTEDKPK